MRMNSRTTPNRRSTNVSLDADLVNEAKALGLNLSQACEKGLIHELKAARERRWIEENRTAIEATNRWVAENGLPFAARRAF